MSMKIAVALGGEYADFLIGLLMEKKYKVTVIDPDKAFCEHLCASYNVNAVLGDPCRQFILEEAGIRNYDVILALGREDTDNLRYARWAGRFWESNGPSAWCTTPGTRLCLRSWEWTGQ